MLIAVGILQEFLTAGCGSSKCLWFHHYWIWL